MKLEEPVIIIEESDKMQPVIFEALLGHKYIVDHSLINAQQWGWPGRRVRLWCVCFHREFVLDVYSSLKNVIKLFQRQCEVTLDVFFMDAHDSAHKAELLRELGWAAAWLYDATRDDAYLGAFKSGLSRGEARLLLRRAFRRIALATHPDKVS